MFVVLKALDVGKRIRAASEPEQKDVPRYIIIIAFARNSICKKTFTAISWKPEETKDYFP